MPAFSARPRGDRPSTALVVLLVIGLVAGACGSEADDDGRATAADVTIDRRELATSACSGRFVAHDLEHTTLGRGAVNAMTDGTGAGVFVDDLDGDGLPEIVLPNLARETTVFTNRGQLEFERSVLVPEARFRQAVAIDLDHDGRRDLVLTTGVGPPQAFYATDDGYDRREVRDWQLTSYSVAPGDLDGDGDVDLLASSYNAELTANRDPRALNQVNIGTAVYRPTADVGRYDEQLLTKSAQALVSQIIDIDGDGRADAVVGNDLGTPDRIWRGTAGGLTLTQIFATTTLSTMSLDVADIDNDGDRDVIATDMAPMPGAPLDVWQPVFDDIEAARVDDVQVPANAVQRNDDGTFAQVADAVGVGPTGWSWSGVLGDLDNDGWVDLYVVNGMQATAIFDTLPDGELVEANQAFRNEAGQFVTAPEWGLADEAGGRGMAMADLDLDGDLDIVVNNLGEPARIHENQLCAGNAVIVDPTWSATANLDALGAVVTVSDGQVDRERVITSVRGYLSTSPTRAHVGVGAAEGPFTVTVEWPDGAITRLDDVTTGQLVTIDRASTATEGSS